MNESIEKMIIKSINDVNKKNYWYSYKCIYEIIKKMRKNENNIYLPDSLDQVFEYDKKYPSLCTCPSVNREKEFDPYFQVVSFDTACMHRSKDANPKYKCWKSIFCGINSGVDLGLYLMYQKKLFKE